MTNLALWGKAVEVGWIYLGMKHVGQRFKRLMVGFWNSAHLIEGFFRAREIRRIASTG